MKRTYGIPFALLGLPNDIQRGAAITGKEFSQLDTATIPLGTRLRFGDAHQFRSISVRVRTSVFEVCFHPPKTHALGTIEQNFQNTLLEATVGQHARTRHHPRFNKRFAFCTFSVRRVRSGLKVVERLDAFLAQLRQTRATVLMHLRGEIAAIK